MVHIPLVHRAAYFLHVQEYSASIYIDKDKHVAIWNKLCLGYKRRQIELFSRKYLFAEAMQLQSLVWQLLDKQAVAHLMKMGNCFSLSDYISFKIERER